MPFSTTGNDFSVVLDMSSLNYWFYLRFLHWLAFSLYLKTKTEFVLNKNGNQVLGKLSYSRNFWKNLKDSERVQKIPEYSKRVSNDNKRFIKIPKNSKRFKNITKHSKKSERFQKNFMDLKGTHRSKTYIHGNNTQYTCIFFKNYDITACFW